MLSTHRSSGRHLLVVSLSLCTALVLGIGNDARAQQLSGPTAQALYQWTAPSAEQQLAQDSTAIPSGQGAIFVPVISNGQDEPEALVFQGERQVASGPNGRRVIVPPGSYSVRIGSGPRPQTVEVSVDVKAADTTVVPVMWGGIKVDVVDENNIPHRGSYELIRVRDRQPYTVGFGVDSLVGERLPTLLVPPGLYRIVRPGANYRTRTDFSTVLVPEGALVHYKLVLDPADGRLLGSGVVSPDDDDDRVEELADLQDAANPEFARRVGRAIERRRLANHGIEFGWCAPALLLREFAAMVWQLMFGRLAAEEDPR